MWSTYSKKILDSAVGVVEGGPHSNVDLRPLESHGLHIRDSLRALLPNGEGILVQRARGIDSPRRSRRGRSCRGNAGCLSRRRGRGGRRHRSRGGRSRRSSRGRLGCRGLRFSLGLRIPPAVLAGGVGTGPVDRIGRPKRVEGGGGIPYSRHRQRIPSLRSCRTRRYLHP